MTNAPSVKNLEDMGYQIGGSVAAPVYGVPLAAGRDLNIMPDKEEKNKVYFGVTTTVGFGTPGSEFHVEMGQTGSLEGIEFNIFDVPENVYRSIMEW